MFFRAFQESDYAALQALDLAYQHTLDPNFNQLPDREREGRLRSSLAALKFFERSEHSFVADEDGDIQGAIFAQSVWHGDKPTVLVTALMATDPVVARGLLRACSKSAYDTAIYEVHAPLLQAHYTAAEAEEFRAVGVYAVRYLGSRAQTGAGASSIV